MMLWKGYTKTQTFYKIPDKEKFITFEYDEGGWNNIRLALETVIIFALILNRTLVIPPELNMYLLNAKKSKLKDYIDIDFFYHPALKVIDYEDYLNGLPDNIEPPKNNKNEYPIDWLRENGMILDFNYETIFIFPKDLKNNISDIDYNNERFKYFKQHFDSNPSKNKMYIIQEKEFNAPIIHFLGSGQSRLIQYFSSKMYFESNDMHKYVRSFIRNHIKYNDEIFNKAEKVIEELDKNHNDWCSVHLRRGDFQYKDTRITIDELLESLQKKIPHGKHLYIATDESDKSFFDLLHNYYSINFFDDFDLDIKNKNHIGMIEQIIASKGRIFYGTYLSTFTHYIKRMRGYQGLGDSWYTNLAHHDFYKKYPEDYKFICTWAHENSDVWVDISD